MEASNGRPATQDPDRTPLPLLRSPGRQAYAAYRRDWLISVRRVDTAEAGSGWTGYAFELDASGRPVRRTWETARSSSLAIALELIHALVDNHDRARTIARYGVTACRERAWRMGLKCCPDCSHSADALTTCTGCGMIGGAL